MLAVYAAQVTCLCTVLILAVAIDLAILLVLFTSKVQLVKNLKPIVTYKYINGYTHDSVLLHVPLYIYTKDFMKQEIYK